MEPPRCCSRTMRCVPPSGSSRPDGGGWWMWTWRSSSTGSTTTCCSGRLAKRIADRRLLGLIRRYLEAGILAHGVVIERVEGTPQGGPLSPLLANVLLDDVDQELEKRGHTFARYADDCNVYVRSKRAGEDVLQTLRRLYARLRLQVNESKSAVARPWDRKFPGYSFWVGAGAAGQTFLRSRRPRPVRSDR